MSTLLSARTSPRSFDQMGPGPFSRLEPKAAELLLGLGALVGAQDEKPLVNQYHRAEVFYLLLHGEVEFCLEVDGQSQGVGRSQRPWTPVGWSGFRDPFRYATSVRVTRYSELLRFRTDQMLRLFEQEPAMATDFFQALAELAAPLLVDVYEGLVGSLHAESKLRHWSATRATEPPSSSSSLREPGVSGAIPLEVGELQGSEAMVTNAAPDPRGLLRRSAFFEHYPDLAVEMLAQEATISYFCRGDAVLTQGGTADELVVLAGGQVRLEYRGSSGKTAALRSYRALGQVLSFCLLDSDRFEPTSVRGMRDGSVIRIGRGALRRLFALYPDWGRLYGQQSLALTGRQLQGARAHLLGEAFDREFLAVDNLIEQCRTQLAVSSELHKLPHLLRSAVTLSDALRLVDTARERGRGIELHVAELCHELLGSVRREQRFFSSLRDAFEQVVYAPPGDSPEKLRRTNAESFIRMFSQIPSRIEGLGHLPERGGNIFIFNHLRNHESNTRSQRLPADSRLALHQLDGPSPALRRPRGARCPSEPRCRVRSPGLLQPSWARCCLHSGV